MKQDISPGRKPYWIIKIPISTHNQQLNNSAMVLLNGKTYSPSSYVGSLRFTRMEKTVRVKDASGDDYPTLEQVRVVSFSSFGEKTQSSL